VHRATATEIEPKALAVATLELRIEEYTGILDAMTGGGVSRQAAAAANPQQ
jgi:hypothetical protein